MIKVVKIPDISIYKYIHKIFDFRAEVKYFFAKSRKFM